jgi:hypothetical protein
MDVAEQDVHSEAQTLERTTDFDTLSSSFEIVIAVASKFADAKSVVCSAPVEACFVHVQ